MIYLAAIFALALIVVILSQVVSLLNCFFWRHPLLLFSIYVPDWRFFAPKPATGHHYILGLPRNENEWRILWSSRRARWYRLLYNPSRRSAAAIHHLETRLGATKLADQNIEGSGPFHLARIICERLSLLSIGKPCQHYIYLIRVRTEGVDEKRYHLVLSFPADFDGAQ